MFYTGHVTNVRSKVMETVYCPRIIILVTREASSWFSKIIINRAIYFAKLSYS